MECRKGGSTGAVVARQAESGLLPVVIFAELARPTNLAPRLDVPPNLPLSCYLILALQRPSGRLTSSPDGLEAGAGRRGGRPSCPLEAVGASVAAPG